MDLSVRKSDLLRELHFFQGIIERKNTIPILANLLVEAGTGDTIKLLATDLELGLRSQCKASIKKPGVLTLPAKKLFEIVRELPETDHHIPSKRVATPEDPDQPPERSTVASARGYPAFVFRRRGAGGRVGSPTSPFPRVAVRLAYHGLP